MLSRQNKLKPLWKSLYRRLCIGLRVLTGTISFSLNDTSNPITLTKTMVLQTGRDENNSRKRQDKWQASPAPSLIIKKIQWISAPYKTENKRKTGAPCPWSTWGYHVTTDLAAYSIGNNGRWLFHPQHPLWWAGRWRSCPNFYIPGVLVDLQGIRTHPYQIRIAT